MGNFNRIALIGTHGAGKGYIREEGAKQESYDKILNPPIVSYVSPFWKAIGKPKLDDIPLYDRFKYQFSLIGACINQILENEVGFFERSPLDMIGYCYLLEDKLTKALAKGSINEDYYEFCKAIDLVKMSTEDLYPLCEECIDVLVYIPFDERIIQMRGEVTNYRELKSNSELTDRFMKVVLQRYFGYSELKEPTTKRRTKFICLNADPENRLETLKVSLENLNDVQFVFNGYNPLV